MYKTIFSFIFLFTANLIVAQVSPTSSPQRFVEMTAHSEIEVVPDEIYIEISIQEKIKKSDNSEIEAKEILMKQAIVSKGIDLKYLSIKDEISGYSNPWKKSGSILKKKDFILKLRDAKLIGIVFQEMDKLEIEDVSIYQIKYSKQDSLKKEMRIQAIKSAKDKVDYLLSAIAESKDKLIEVREVIDENQSMIYTNQERSLNRLNNSISLGGGIESMETQFKKIKISAIMYLKYGLK
jgi:uncharacterized protein YggE